MAVLSTYGMETLLGSADALDGVVGRTATSPSTADVALTLQHRSDRVRDP